MIGITRKILQMIRKSIGELYLTPQEIIEKYPDLAMKFNWGTSEIGTILKCKILDGYYDRGRRMSLIKESSLIKLIRFVNDSIEAQKIMLNE